MRCIPNTRHLVPISSTQQPKLLKSVMANGRIYIRPIQKDLDLSPVGDMDEVIIVVCYKELLGWIIVRDSKCFFFNCRRLLRGVSLVTSRCH